MRELTLPKKGLAPLLNELPKKQALITARGGRHEHPNLNLVNVRLIGKSASVDFYRVPKEFALATHDLFGGDEVEYTQEHSSLTTRTSLAQVMEQPGYHVIHPGELEDVFVYDRTLPGLRREFLHDQLNSNEDFSFVSKTRSCLARTCADWGYIKTEVHITGSRRQLKKDFSALDTLAREYAPNHHISSWKASIPPHPIEKAYVAVMEMADRAVTRFFAR